MSFLYYTVFIFAISGMTLSLASLSMDFRSKNEMIRTATRVKKPGQLLKYWLPSRGAALFGTGLPGSATSEAASARTIDAKP
jgi:hypothetical protein